MCNVSPEDKSALDTDARSLVQVVSPIFGEDGYQKRVNDTHQYEIPFTFGSLGFVKRSI